MGKGVIDNQYSNGSCGDRISNVVAVNLGATLSLNDRMTLNADVWSAELAEKNAGGHNSLGTEIDLNLGVELFDDLTLDLIAAYLFAGNATTDAAIEEENPYEIGTQLLLKF